MRGGLRGLRALSAGVWLVASAALATDYYVSPTAGSGGNGSFGNPWQLQIALNQPSQVQPGDTIWLRGGTYTGSFTSNLNGTSASPIIVRQYTGERATLDSGVNANCNAIVTVKGSYTWFWGFEVMSSDTKRSTTTTGSDPPDITRGDGFALDQSTPHPGIKFINLIIHDARQGVSFWKEAQNSDIYGCLIYYNGWDAPDRGHGHGTYVQNQTGTKNIHDNIFFSGFGYGIHAYTEGSYIDNIAVQGNTNFNSGNLEGTSGNLLLGGLVVAHNPVINNNFLYRSPPATDFDQGVSAGCSNSTVNSNYVAGDTNFVSCLPATMTGNTFYGEIAGFTQSQYPSNSYAANRPSGVKIFLRPNTYEPGRANITIYNWDLDSTVSVDLSSVVSVGGAYEIHNAENFFGAPVASGTYNGGTVAIPMTGLSIATPVGWPAPTPGGPEFHAFVVQSTLGPGEFFDVSATDPFQPYIHKVAVDGISSGCGGGNFCPDAAVTRAQMSVLLLRGIHGSAYNPPPATGQVFQDVSASSFAAGWIEELAAENITSGCGSGKYCPSNPVTRAQMAVFLIRSEHGGSYTPPAPTGVFPDVPVSSPYARWIEALYHEGITSGCGGGMYCPNSISTRGQMAVFLVKTFNLP